MDNCLIVSQTNIFLQSYLEVKVLDVNNQEIKHIYQLKEVLW